MAVRGNCFVQHLLRIPAPGGLAHGLAVQVVFFVASHTTFLSSFFRFVVLV
jgi:hypothetical protein